MSISRQQPVKLQQFRKSLFLLFYTMKSQDLIETSTHNDFISVQIKHIHTNQLAAYLIL